MFNFFQKTNDMKIERQLKDKQIIKDNKVMVNRISMVINSPQPGIYEVNMYNPHYNLTVDGPDMSRKAQGKTPRDAIQNLLKELPELYWTQDPLFWKDN